jgi:hypothetical protein
MTNQIVTLTVPAIIRITRGLETMIAVLVALPTVGPRISQTAKVGVYTTLVGRATTVTTIMVEAALVVGTEEAKDGEIQVKLVDMTIDQEVITVLHATEVNGTMDRLAAKLMARATMTALEALCLTSMVILGRGASTATTANDSSTTGAISASVASMIPRIGSTNLLKRGSTNLPKGAAMRWSQITSASKYQLRKLTCLIRVVPIAARFHPAPNGRAIRQSRENSFGFILASRQTSGSNGSPEGATLTVRGMEEVTLLELDQFFHDHDAAIEDVKKGFFPPLYLSNRYVVSCHVDRLQKQGWHQHRGPVLRYSRETGASIPPALLQPSSPLRRWCRRLRELGLFVRPKLVLSLGPAGQRGVRGVGPVSAEPKDAVTIVRLGQPPREETDPTIVPSEGTHREWSSTKTGLD